MEKEDLKTFAEKLLGGKSLGEILSEAVISGLSHAPSVLFPSKYYREENTREFLENLAKAHGKGLLNLKDSDTRAFLLQLAKVHGEAMGEALKKPNNPGQ